MPARAAAPLDASRQVVADIWAEISDGLSGPDQAIADATEVIVKDRLPPTLAVSGFTPDGRRRIVLSERFLASLYMLARAVAIGERIGRPELSTHYANFLGSQVQFQRLLPPTEFLLLVPEAERAALEADEGISRDAYAGFHQAVHFILLHELAHQVKGHRWGPGLEGSIEREREADQWAIEQSSRLGTPALGGLLAFSLFQETEAARDLTGLPRTHPINTERAVAALDETIRFLPQRRAWFASRHNSSGQTYVEAMARLRQARDLVAEDRGESLDALPHAALADRAIRGDTAAQLKLCTRFEDKTGATAVEAEAALDWCTRAATPRLGAGGARVAYANYALGHLYSIARGVPKDFLLAEQHLRRAARKGYAPAVVTLERLKREPRFRARLEAQKQRRLGLREAQDALSSTPDLDWIKQPDQPFVDFSVRVINTTDRGLTCRIKFAIDRIDRIDRTNRRVMEPTDQLLRLATFEPGETQRFSGRLRWAADEATMPSFRTFNDCETGIQPWTTEAILSAAGK